jgi:hypothetical protein
MRDMLGLDLAGAASYSLVPTVAAMAAAVVAGEGVRLGLNCLMSHGPKCAQVTMFKYQAQCRNS